MHTTSLEAALWGQNGRECGQKLIADIRAYRALFDRVQLDNLPDGERRKLDAIRVALGSLECAIGKIEVENSKLKRDFGII